MTIRRLIDKSPRGRIVDFGVRARATTGLVYGDFTPWPLLE